MDLSLFGSHKNIIKKSMRMTVMKKKFLAELLQYLHRIQKKISSFFSLALFSFGSIHFSFNVCSFLLFQWCFWDLLWFAVINKQHKERKITFDLLKTIGINLNWLKLKSFHFSFCYFNCCCHYFCRGDIVASLRVSCRYSSLSSYSFVDFISHVVHSQTLYLTRSLFFSSSFFYYYYFSVLLSSRLLCLLQMCFDTVYCFCLLEYEVNVNGI